MLRNIANFFNPSTHEVAAYLKYLVLAVGFEPTMFSTKGTYIGAT